MQENKITDNDNRKVDYMWYLWSLIFLDQCTKCYNKVSGILIEIGQKMYRYY